MTRGAPPADPDPRREVRHRVDLSLIAEHRSRGDVMIHLANISVHGFMAVGATDLGKGERVIVRLPAIGRIEAFLTWNNGDRAGFQFERVLRLPDFARLLESLPSGSGR